MEIESSVTSASGEKHKVLYKDIDALTELGDRKVSAVHAYCFVEDKLLIVYSENKGYWVPPGGGVESEETPEAAISREVSEETNMRVIKQVPIGFQDIFEPNRVITQLRSVCLVQPQGEFVSDPDGDITEIRLIDPADYKKYFDWGEIGDYLMKRALELKSAL